MSQDAMCQYVVNICHYPEYHFWCVFSVPHRHTCYVPAGLAETVTLIVLCSCTDAAFTAKGMSIRALWGREHKSKVDHDICLVCYRGRRPSFSMPLGRTPTGRIVDWKPPSKETPHKSAGGDSLAQQGSKDTQKAEVIPSSGKHMVYAKWVMLLQN